MGKTKMSISAQKNNTEANTTAKQQENDTQRRLKQIGGRKWEEKWTGEGGGLKKKSSVRG